MQKLQTEILGLMKFWFQVSAYSNKFHCLAALKLWSKLFSEPRCSMFQKIFFHSIKNKRLRSYYEVPDSDLIINKAFMMSSFHFKKFMILIHSAHMHSECACERRCLERAEATPGAGVTRSYELASVGAGHQIWVNRKSSICSQLLSHLTSSKQFSFKM